MKFKPALTSLLATFAIVGAAATASAAPAISTTVLSGDPAAPNASFKVLVSISGTTSTLEQATLKVSYDSRRTDLTAVEFPAVGFGGSDLDLIDPATAPATADANDFKHVAGWDANNTNTLSAPGGDVFVLTFTNGKWPAKPLNIRLAATASVRPGGFAAESLIFDPGAPDAQFGIDNATFDNSATINIGATDTDGDGIPDTVEAFNPSSAGATPNTNLYITDSDADGLSDYTEREITLTNPRKRDTDGDGLLDGFEVLLGTNPLVANTGVVDADRDGYPASANDDSGNPIDLVAKLGSADPDDANPDVDGDAYRDGYEYIKLGLAAVSDANIKPTLGDINNSRVTAPVKNGVTTADALIVLRVFGQNSLFLTLPGTVNVNKQAYDVNRDGNINTADALILLRYFGGVVTSLPLTNPADPN